ncbi:unnamed protein product [Allacma fusca]|uniref:Uncharacterized protein n=1 Tax=Allacma fusca TaxID=39272 RepID=A0A8J2PDC4_9HEXA|nr:unnamed protein product [Allacma fusca]
MEQFFMQTPNADIINVRERYHLNPNWIQCVLDGVSKSKEVCIGWDFVIESLAQLNATVNKQFYSAFKSRKTPKTVLTNTMFQKNSPYFEGMNNIQYWLRDTGHEFHWQKETEVIFKNVGKSWMQTQNHTQIYEDLFRKFLKSNENGVTAFTIQNLIAPFVALLVGVVISSLIFMAENRLRLPGENIKPKSTCFHFGARALSRKFIGRPQHFNANRPLREFIQNTNFPKLNA